MSIWKETSSKRSAYLLWVWFLFCGFMIGTLIGGCAAGPIIVPCHDKGIPYTHERPTVPFHITMTNNQGVDSWNADGAPTVLTVHNPTNKYREVHVVCEPSVPPTYIDYGHIEGYFCLPPHTEAMRLTEFMNIDATRQVCFVKDAYVATPATCITHDVEK